MWEKSGLAIWNGGQQRLQKDRDSRESVGPAGF